MIIYQVKARTSFTSKENINHQLDIVDDILTRADGGVFCAERTASPKLIKILLRIAKAKANEQLLNDALKATDFAVKRITALGTPHETYVALGGWLTPQALARKKTQNYLIDPARLPATAHRHPAPTQKAGHHAAIAKFFVQAKSIKPA
jgi:hypothetical protein